jgi:hypothetical protein
MTGVEIQRRVPGAMGPTTAIPTARSTPNSTLRNARMCPQNTAAPNGPIRRVASGRPHSACPRSTPSVRPDPSECCPVGREHPRLDRHVWRRRGVRRRPSQLSLDATGGHRRDGQESDRESSCHGTPPALRRLCVADGCSRHASRSGRPGARWSGPVGPQGGRPGTVDDQPVPGHGREGEPRATPVVAIKLAARAPQAHAYGPGRFLFPRVRAAHASTRRRTERGKTTRMMRSG